MKRFAIAALVAMLCLSAQANANFGGVAVRQRVVVRQRFVAPVAFRSSFVQPVFARQRFAVQSFGYGHSAAFVQPFSYGYAAPVLGIGAGCDCYGGAGFSAGFRSRAFLGLGFGY